jgi:hypothetical protein
MPAAGAAGLLTPAFFEQQQQQQQQRAPKPLLLATAQPPAAAGGSTPVALQDTAASVSAANGPGHGGNPLLGLLSRWVPGFRLQAPSRVDSIVGAVCVTPARGSARRAAMCSASARVAYRPLRTSKKSHHVTHVSEGPSKAKLIAELIARGHHLQPPAPHEHANMVDVICILLVACRAAKTTPAPAVNSTTGQPQPPIGALSPEVTRDKVKAALIRLANNDEFVNLLAKELRTVGLLQ